MPIAGLAGFVGVSPDGTRVAYSVNGKERYQLFLKTLDRFDGQPLAGTDGGKSVRCFSPDGAWIAFSDRSAEKMLKKIPVAGGAGVATRS